MGKFVIYHESLIRLFLILKYIGIGIWKKHGNVGNRRGKHVLIIIMNSIEKVIQLVYTIGNYERIGTREPIFDLAENTHQIHQKPKDCLYQCWRNETIQST